MHPDIHLQLHTYRSAELHREAAALRPARRGIKAQLGWALVEFGLRLTQERSASAAVRAPRAA
ncbi:hypothetical protein [Streptomyces sp. NPDC058620]|uniref:hypothetical protein n=1 Tax=Streptomyces sp. NPDC058620 TaxID=3346560 RepID=UPI003656BB0D